MIECNNVLLYRISGSEIYLFNKNEISYLDHLTLIINESIVY